MNKSTTSIIIVVIIVAIVLYFWHQSNNEHFDNNRPGKCPEKSVKNKISYTEPTDSEMNQIPVNDLDLSDTIEDENSEMETDQSIVYEQSSDESDNLIRKKFHTRDRARDGKYKHGSYSEGKRGGMHDAALNFIDRSNELSETPLDINDGFVANEDTKAKFAPYKPENRHVDKYDINEIYNKDNYLPNEQSINPEWWDMPPEPTSVKNRHLINTARAIPITSIGGSLRNAGRDIRGTPPCPKFPVSPWMQSTIEPDTNLKSLN